MFVYKQFEYDMISNNNAAHGQVHLALSRAKVFEGIILSNLESNILLSRSHGERTLA